MRTVYQILIPIPLICLLVFDVVPIPHFKFSFLCKDPHLLHVYNGDTVSAKNLLLATLFGPLVIITIVEAIKEESFKNLNRRTLWVLYRRCLIGSIFVILITECIKSIVKEPRPHFFHSCKPDETDHCRTQDKFIFEYECTNDKLNRFHTNDLVRSFPSGHSSLSVFVGLYCSYVIYVRIPSHSKTSLLKPFLIGMCLSWSLLCSLSRISDKRHHWWDVLGGAVLGICGGFYTLFFLYKKDCMKLNVDKENYLQSLSTS